MKGFLRNRSRCWVSAQQDKREQLSPGNNHECQHQWRLVLTLSQASYRLEPKRRAGRSSSPGRGDPSPQIPAFKPRTSIGDQPSLLASEQLHQSSPFSWAPPPRQCPHPESSFCPARHSEEKKNTGKNVSRPSLPRYQLILPLTSVMPREFPAMMTRTTLAALEPWLSSPSIPPR